MFHCPKSVMMRVTAGYIIGLHNIIYYVDYIVIVIIP